MIDIDAWMEALTRGLRDAFGERLLFVGLQGSHRRGEAMSESDIDAVVILDVLEMADLRRYRRLLATLPHADKACGFVGGAGDLRDWPRHELFQFRNDTVAWHGDLDPLLPPVSRGDIEDGVRIAASGLYHLACHLYVHGPDEGRAEGLRDAYKGAFFMLQASHFLATDRYVPSKGGLLRELRGGDREILDVSVNWSGLAAERVENPDRFFSLMLDWSRGLLAKQRSDHGV